jgi:hypothetical protein
MKRFWIFPVLLVPAALFVGCGGSTEDSKTSASAPPSEVIGHGSGELNCETYPFDNSGYEDWRQDSYSFGPFGVSHNLAAGSRQPDGLLHAKTPMLVEGHRTVVLSVPESEAGRVGIETLKSDRPLSTLILKPCAHKTRTLWAAGFVLRDRRPVTLDVRVGVSRGTVRVGPPESPR